MIQFLQAVFDGLSQGGVYAVLAVGVAVVSAVMSFPNFAHGWLVMWAASITVSLTAAIPLLPALLIATAIVVVIAVVGGRLTFLVGSPAGSEVLMLKSLAFGLVLQAAAVLFFGDAPRLYPAPDWSGGVIVLGDLRISAASLTSLSVALVALGGVLILLRATDLGLKMRATAQSMSTAALVGVRTRRVVTTALVIAGVLACIASFLWYAKAGSVTPRSGLEITMVAFVALVLGGLRNIGGAVLGGLLLGLVDSFMAAYLPSDVQGLTRALTYTLLIAVLLLRPDGLLQRKVVPTK
ncbi:branched-chain amino acid ABC transporter permease [Microbacterium sp. CJ77]|uniref:branched-chain amino acid ABC transporter permease n=1 Tax=Microbacterium sp. CJ77 TaxID=2079201 RepID=UPI000CD9F5F7|nr:branched-chain amino acid ABC transporter permease [Microbacterium sp. CJ77]